MIRQRFVFIVFVIALVLFIVLSVVLLRYVGRRAMEQTPPQPGPNVERLAPADLNIALGNPSDATTDASNKNNYLLVRPQFALSYNNEKGEANWVSWHLQATDIGDVERQNNFHPEANLPVGFKRVTPSDYTATSYDRGHLCNSKDRTTTEDDNSETFSMANMLPQTPDLNRHVWEQLESYSRTLARGGNELYIVAGGYGTLKTIGRANKVNVPTNCWKVLLVLPQGSDLAQNAGRARVIAVDMPNVQGIALDSWQKYITTVADIEGKTGYHFFTDLPAEAQNALKSKRDAGTP